MRWQPSHHEESGTPPPTPSVSNAATAGLGAPVASPVQCTKPASGHPPDITRSIGLKSAQEVARAAQSRDVRGARLRRGPRLADWLAVDRAGAINTTRAFKRRSDRADPPRANLLSHAVCQPVQRPFFSDPSRAANRARNSDDSASRRSNCSRSVAVGTRRQPARLDPLGHVLRVPLRAGARCP